MKYQFITLAAILSCVISVGQNNVTSTRKRNNFTTQRPSYLKIESPNPKPASSPLQPLPLAAASSSANWNNFTSSTNIYGVLIDGQKPLQYNPDLNAVSFIHRKSPTYAAAPFSNSGAIVAMISTNWGGTWDSTCIYSDNANVGRYPTGGIYNPIGNSN
ncbi:MAG: hypothetical protein HYX39_09165 [Bacteroidetes bacterium]|nr:hypothetical protein [Bacteroidota bacterium]